MAQKLVRITKDVNGEGLEGLVLPESVEAWEAAGWTVADDGDEEVRNVEPRQPALGTDAAPSTSNEEE